MKFKFPLNAIDKIYAEKTNLPFPVSCAAGAGPGPVPPGPQEVNSTVTYTETEETVWKMELSMEWPSGMSFEALTAQYPDWIGSVTSDGKVINFNADDITVDYITVNDLVIDVVPEDGDECTVIISNDGNTLYTSNTAAHVVEIPILNQIDSITNVSQNGFQANISLDGE